MRAFSFFSKLQLLKMSGPIVLPVEQRYFNWTDGSFSSGNDAFGLKVRELDSRALANVLLSGDI